MKKLLYTALALLSLASCKKDEFKVSGQISGAEGKSLVLEVQDAAAGWLALDSVALTSSGEFAMEAPAPESPTLYRLALGGQYVYLPVDSTESLTLKAPARGFAEKFTLSGSPQAEQLTSFEHEAARVQALDNADSTASFRRRVYAQYLQQGCGNLLSYYILTRQFGSGYLIDYTDPLYAAVATAFQTYRPDDPHTLLLSERAKQGQTERRKAQGKGVKMQATATGIVPIALPGKDGKEVALTSLLGKGKPVVVAFVSLDMKDAPAINRTLRALYEAGRCDIYEVCLDADQYEWRQASAALPWTVVLDPDGTHSRAALAYNVASLPAFFIYNAAGELANSTRQSSGIASLL